MRADIAALERRARESLPAGVYDFYAGGAGPEETLAANVSAWRQYMLLPRVLRDVSIVDTSLQLRGQPETTLATPIAIGPTAGHGLADPAAELATAEAAAQAGALFVMSTRSSRPIEETVRPVNKAGGAWWFQVYVMRNRDLTASLVRRAVGYGARALVLTGDTPVVGQKRRDRGDWDIPESVFTANTGPFDEDGTTDQAPDITLDTIGWLADLSGLPVFVKGVLRGDDARACAEAGAAGVVVSNHGGRQLDRATPTALALPAVVSALAEHDSQTGTHTEVMVDGGLRVAEDVLTALALGARVVFLGRPILWALACDGADGVRGLLGNLTDDLAHVMALAGATSLPEVAGLATLPPAGWTSA